MRTLLSLITATAVVFVSMQSARAVELLIGGGFDDAAPQGWTLQEFLTGTATSVDAVEQIDFANQPEALPGEKGLWFRSFTGTPPNPSNAILSQSTTATAGETYTFKGWSRWEPFYSGAVNFMDIFSPYDPGMTGTVPSETDTTMELAFLNASNSVIGAPVTLDLRTVQMGDNMWREHSLAGVAPVGTARARVTASARDMMANALQESAFFDNFSLTGSSAPTTEKLFNAALNLPETPGTAWTLTEAPAGKDSLGLINFAAHTGSNGVWLKAFAGNAESLADAILQQTVPGVAGGNYTFSGWSRWETNYSGGVTTLSVNSPLDPTGTGTVPSPTQTKLELAFLNASNAVIGTPVTLDLRTVQTNGGGWLEHTLNGVAPAGTVNVRVTASAIGMVFNTDPQQSAFFDDFSLQGPSLGDFDGDLDVDGTDLLLIQRGIGTTTSATDLAAWRTNYGAGGATAAAAAVPEPSTAVGALLGAAAVALWRRRGRCVR